MESSPSGIVKGRPAGVQDLAPSDRRPVAFAVANNVSLDESGSLQLARLSAMTPTQ